ncbi:MAG TPA: non-canonical purine NTP pyrophosphatase [Candidatus Saccharimonadales bacterium]|nr:non-canonical purine NTP pyrophosphatase [Candidatus Saccharimonadales bacterium]
MNSLTFITGNMYKVTWTQRYIHLPIKHKKLDLTEIQSLDPKEVVEHKVKEAYKIIKQPVLVEDTSVVFNAWGKLPGPFIKFFLEELGNEGMSKMLTGPDRSAVARVIYGVYNGKELYFFEGAIEGTISKKPMGTNGFGWNPIFIPNGWKKTYAEMTNEEMDKVGIRRIALEKMKKKLQTK